MTHATADERPSSPSGAVPDGRVFVVSRDEPSRPLAAHRDLITVGRSSAFLEGVLHDRADLIRDVGAGDRERSDTDLLLLAYERWGVAGFGRLRGSFAFGLIDSSNDEAYFARDPVGHRPFFYTELSGRLFASTSQRALLNVPGISREVNRVLIADRLCHRWNAPEETYFAAIRRIQPGSHLRITRGRVDQIRHWDPSGPMRRRPLDDLLAEFDHAIDHAVDRVLAAPSRSAVFLSGGFDSISVAALAADHARVRERPAPLALSIGFPDPSCDERLIQRSVARDLGMPIDLVNFDDALAGGEGVLGAGLSLNRVLDSPLLNAWSPVYLALAKRAAAGGVHTVLTGGGGDEWLTVSPYLSADMLRAGQFVSLAKFVRTWQRSSTKPAWPIARKMLWRFGARPLLGGLASRIAPRAWDRKRVKRALAADPEWMSSDPTLRGRQAELVERRLCDPNPREGFYLREMRLGLDHQLVLTEHEEYFQWGQLTGTEMQHPYWDPDLIALLYTSHPQDMDQDGRNKALVRHTLARRFPALGFEQQRKVYGADFFAGIMSREGSAIARRLGSLEALGNLGVVNPKRAWATVERAFPGSYRSTFPAWDLLNFESWVRSNI